MELSKAYTVIVNALTFIKDTVIDDTEITYIAQNELGLTKDEMFSLYRLGLLEELEISEYDIDRMDD